MVNYFFQTPFIFTHGVILHLQLDHKVSYLCVLSYVAIMSSEFYFLPIAFTSFVNSLTLCMNLTFTY